MADAPSPWNLGGLSVRELGRRVWSEISKDEVADRAAALAYYFLFALFPTLLFLTSLLGLLPLPGLMDRLLAYANHALPGDASSIVTRTLGEIQAGARGGLLSIGVLAALWAASAGMASMMNTLNVAYDVEDPRSWWKRRLVAVLLTIGFSVFILTALVLIVFGPRIGEALAGRMGLGPLFTLVWNVVSVPVVMAFVLIGIALVYYFAPATRTHWRWVTPGSVVALALWLAMSLGLRWYVANFADYGATYGSIGGVILLMLWLYLSGFVLLVGAEINAEIEHAAAERGAVTAKAPGELEPPTDRVAAPEPGPDDVAVAGEAVARWVGEARRRGWGPLAVLGAGVAAGWLLRRRPVAQVAEAGSGVVTTALRVATAIAALERFHHPRTDEEARAQAIEERRAA
ncbi:MAG TPA: YihY/virulence factor BrkB family protein [Methylomirabilota bacterium]|nr:YihY/virulence factor BrkB family protein [Methylomirabilota bacterium]